ncbi:MAG: glycosyltransferase family 39 protein [Chlorobia bacterium]|nr:glycosyltransferase family 39 protein [Fimbriimonadaceae bacterium]
MTRQTALFVAIALAIVHLALACVYASITPYRTSGLLLGQRDPATGQYQQIHDIGAPDERQHANYVKHLLDGSGFPVLDPADPNLGENYQAHQPPLFYILHAGWSKVTGANLDSPDNGLKVRLLNGLIGAVTVAGTFFLGLWAFRRDDVGLVAAAFVALLPMNAALSGALSNDPLLYCLCTWALAFQAKGCVEGWCYGIALRIGLLCGFAILTKTTAVALFPILILALFIGPNKPTAKQVAVCAGLIVLISAPWLARNQSLYGDPFAISAFNEAFKNSPSRELITQVASVQNVGKDPNLAYWTDWVGWWTARSFFGAFGYMDIFLNERGVPSTGPTNPNALYRMLLALSVVVIALWVFALRKPEWKEHKRMHYFLGSFLLIVVLLFLRFNAQYFQGQARYLFPAISVFGVGVAIAILNLSKARWQVALAVVVILLGALNAYALTRLPGEFKRRAFATAWDDQTQLDPTNVLISNGRKHARVKG